MSGAGRWPCFGFASALSAEEAAKLAAQIADLSRSDRPLGPGLRVLADELPGGRLASHTRRLAGLLEAGVSLDEAVGRQGLRLPAHLGGLLLAGARSGQLTEVLEEVIDMEQRRAEFRRRVWLAVAYPLVLVVILAAIMAVARFCLVEQFSKLFNDFGTVLPAITRIYLVGVGPLAAGMAILAGLAILMPLVLRWKSGPAWLVRLEQAIPLVGPMLRWERLAGCCRLLAALLEQQLPLPEVLRLTAGGLGNADLAAGCRQAAQEVEAGRPLWEALAGKHQFPPSLIPLIRWGDTAHELAEAFRAAAEMYEGRTTLQGTLLETVLLPVVLLVVITFVGTTILALMLPMISLIQKLS